MFEELSTKHILTKYHTQKYRKYFAFNRNAAGFTSETKEQTYTLVSNNTNGAYITDLDGFKYIDLAMGFGSLIFGHNYFPIKEAIKQQMEKSWSVGPISPFAGLLAEKIANATGVERVAFFNSGTEAVMVAIRLAKAVTGKKYFVFFKGSYHGTFDPLLSLKSNLQCKIAEEMVPGVSQNILNESFLLEYGTEESLEFIKKNSASIAAVLAEPVQSRRPDLQPKEFLQNLREITRENNIALIFDEVITGFRISLGGCQQYFGIKADLVTYGKVIGGGLPIGIVAGTEKFLDATDGGFWQFGDNSFPQVKTTFVAGTFCHHPLAMCSALKVIEILSEENGKILDELNTRTIQFCNRMNDFFTQNNYNLKMVNFGSLFRFITSGRSNLIYNQLLINDVYIWEGRNCFLSVAHTNDVIDILEQKIKLSCIQLEHKGILKPLSVK